MDKAAITLGGMTARGAGAVYATTLHVDLLWTDLEDFIEHFERAMGWPKPGRWGYLSGHHLLLGDIAARVHYRLLRDGEPAEPVSGPLKDLDSGHYLRLVTAMQERTEARYEMRAGDAKREILLFHLWTARYRRDRLKVTLGEYVASDNPVYKPLFLSWITARWGEDGVEVREPEDAPPVPEPMPLLTSREKEVVELVDQGLTTREIAERLVISAKTVGKHRSNIAAKRRELRQDEEAPT